MQAKNVKETLTAMEWMLINVGWTQDVAYRDKQGDTLLEVYPIDFSEVGSMCLIGALAAVETTPGVYHSTIRALAKELPDVNLSSFNDRPGQTLQGVLKVIRKAKRKS